MANNKSRWKDLERLIAKELGGQRSLRADYSIKTPDIEFKENSLKNIKIDCKKRKTFKHHSLLLEIERKYCKNKNDIPVLITKQTRSRKIVVSIPFEYFKELFLLYKKYKKKK